MKSPSAKKIRETRKAAGLSQTVAASLIWASMRTWQDWEADKASMHPALWFAFCKRLEEKNLTQD